MMGFTKVAVLGRLRTIILNNLALYTDCKYSWVRKGGMSSPPAYLRRGRCGQMGFLQEIRCKASPPHGVAMECGAVLAYIIKPKISLRLWCALDWLGIFGERQTLIQERSYLHSLHFCTHNQMQPVHISFDFIMPFHHSTSSCVSILTSRPTAANTPSTL